MQEIIERRNNLENELKALEKQVYDLESHYLEETQQSGNIVIGWSNYLTSKGSKAPIYPGFKKPKANTNDHLFSLSSTSSPAVRTFEGDLEKTTLGGGLGYASLSKRNKKKKNYAKVYDGSSYKEKKELMYSGKKEEIYLPGVEDDAKTVDSELSKTNTNVGGKKEKAPGVKKKIAKKSKSKKT